MTTEALDVITTIRVSRNTYEQVKKLAEKSGRTKAAMLRWMILKYLMEVRQ